MCGIYGIVNWDKKQINEKYIQAMINTLNHRGPDGDGCLVRGHVGLGHKRLSIIDLDGGAQPMCNEDESVWISFNGEIYNFPELKKDLIDKGHHFRTNSDTEVIIHGYEEWGERIIERLRGMFAFGIYDHRKKEILIARDRIGIKPLVYYIDRNKFVFASEIKAIIADNTIHREIDFIGLSDYFQYGYVPAPHTMFANIHKLNPGHYLKINTEKYNGHKQIKYWSLNYNFDHSRSAEDTMTELIELLTDSIKIRLISDVPLGAFLSGGIDSSTIVALMAKVASERINTFSIGFEEEEFTEIEHAKVIADMVESNHVEYTVAPDIRELLPALVYHFDEPFSDSSAIPTYYVSKMARKNVTVALSGEGGDELFAGYDRYRHCMGLSLFDFIPLSVRKIIFGGMSSIMPENMKGARFIEGLASDVNDRFFDYMKNQYGAVSRQKIFSKAYTEEIVNQFDEQAFLRNSIDNHIEDPLSRYLDLDLRTYMPNDILTKTDITSMMNSLEVRVPILDHLLIEFVATIPSSLKLNNGKSKFILKEAMQKYLPSQILSRGKMGFGVPIRSWLANELKDITHQYLMNPSQMSGYLDSDVVKDIVLDNEQNIFQSHTGGRLWWILFFEMWYQDVFINK